MLCNKRSPHATQQKPNIAKNKTGDMDQYLSCVTIKLLNKLNSKVRNIYKRHIQVPVVLLENFTIFEDQFYNFLQKIKYKQKLSNLFYRASITLTLKSRTIKKKIITRKKMYSYIYWWMLMTYGDSTAGIKSMSPMSPALQMDSLPTELPGKPLIL